MTTTHSTTTDPREAARARFRDDIASGRTLALAAASNRSIRGYQPPPTRHDFGNVVRVLGTYAATSDQAAQIVARVLPALATTVYQSRPEMAAKVYEAAASAVAEGYTDVIALASPEPPRRSQAHRPYTLPALVALNVWLHAATCHLEPRPFGLGWCLAEMVAEYGVSAHLAESAARASR